MANCTQQFLDFDSVIELSPDKVKSLKVARKRLRDRIRDNFKEKRPEEIKPKFWSQGSFEMGTSVNPIGREGKIAGKEKILYKYDVDDGIYFIGKEEDKKSIDQYHAWIYDAVDGYTGIPPIDKYTCIRTLYADGHHIDQPIYFENSVQGSVPKLAHGKKGWIESDPREFTEWFQRHSETNLQLVRIVRYLKAWCDYQNFIAGTKKMPSGLVMTIWACELGSFDEREDIALKNTLENIRSHVVGQQSKLTCLRPTIPKYENLLEEYKYGDFYEEKLLDFYTSASQAIAEPNQKESCTKWQKHFGSRFSCANAKDEDENANTYTNPAILTANAKSAS